MKKSFLVSYLFLILFLFSCASVEMKKYEIEKKGKFSIASNSDYFSGTIIVSGGKRIKFNLDGLSKDFKISLKDEKIKTNFRYENIIKNSDLKLFLEWLFLECINVECQNFALQNFKLKKQLSDKTGLMIQGNFEKYRLSLKLNDI